jgi:hypothetical protein
MAPNCLCSPNNILSNGYEALSPRGKKKPEFECYYSLPSSVRLRKHVSFTSIPIIDLQGMLLKHVTTLHFTEYNFCLKTKHRTQKSLRDSL